jgi:hypothetical protein
LTAVTRGDLGLIAALLVLGLLLLALGGSSGEVGRRATVRTLAGETFTVDLTHPQILEVSGPLGPTTIAVRQGTIAIVDSPCPHKICVGKGPVSEAGDYVACLPNGVVVTIGGGRDYDGITP